MLVCDQVQGFRLSGKTGWGYDGDQDIGWYVGYIEKGEEVYVYCTQVLSSEQREDKAAFRRLYLDLTKSLLEYGLENWRK